MDVHPDGTTQNKTQICGEVEPITTPPLNAKKKEDRTMMTLNEWHGVQNAYYIKPIGGQKSYYNKAVQVNMKNGEKFLVSYATAVCKIDKDGNFHRLWGGYSATTMKHINDFNTYNGVNKGGKAWWDTLEPETDYTGKSIAYDYHGNYTTAW